MHRSKDWGGRESTMLQDGEEKGQSEAERHRESKLGFRQTDQAEGREGKILIFNTYFILDVLCELCYLTLKISSCSLVLCFQFCNHKTTS